MCENIIDVTSGNFTKKEFRKFCTHIKDENELIYIVTNTATIAIPFNKLCDELKQEKFDNFFTPNEIFVFSLLESDVQMYIDTNDIIWWRKTTKSGSRLDKLFDNIKIGESSKTTKTNKIYKIVGGIQIDKSMTEIEFFDGDNKSCVEFINMYYMKWNIRKRFDKTCQIKFVINYENEEDLTISTNWKTLEELEKKGVLKI